jgi:putative oxidoreductase
MNYFELQSAAERTVFVLRNKSWCSNQNKLTCTSRIKSSNTMKNKILFVASLLFALMFINGGLNKFFMYMPMPENPPAEGMKDFAAMMEISWLMPLIAIMEIIGGILIIIPRTRALGAVVIFPIMIGILLTHIFVDTSTLPVALILAAILGWIMYENRAKYLPMIK